MGRFYYDAYWRTWTRRLLTTSNNIFDLSLTSNNKDWKTIKEERIRIHRTHDQKIEFVNVLPKDVKDMIFENVGPVLGYRLLNFKYIKVIGLPALRELNYLYQDQGGIPATKGLSQ